MKNYKLPTLAACFLAANLMAQTVGQYLTQGTNALVAHDIVGAYSNFNAAAALAPANGVANAFLAMTRLLVLPQTTAGSNFLNQLYLTNGSRTIYNWTATQPVDTNGNTIWPPSYNSSTPIAFYRTNIMAAMAASGTNLANITDPGFTLPLLSSETAFGNFPGQDVTVDYGDVQMLRALLAAGQFAGYTLNAQNASVIIPTLQKMSQTNGLTLQSVLAAYPNLLTLSSAADLASSKTTLSNAIVFYFAASDFIRNVRAPDAVRLFNLGPDEAGGEAQFRTGLTNALLSLNGPAQINPPSLVSVNASNYFSGAKTLRSLVPKFIGDSYVNNSLPDYTFGGILLNEPAYVTEAALRRQFYSYAGIYIGENGQYYNYGSAVSDNNGYANGSFAVFIGTNQQATLSGHDDGSGFDDGSDFGLFAQFTVDQGGNWSFQNSAVSGYGSLDRQGNFYGELDYTNGVSVWLNGAQQTPFGPFQNSAGYFTGSFSGSQSGSLFVIVAADGEIFYVPVQGGQVGSGGSSQFGSNNQFTNTQVSGTIVKGTLTPSTPSIAGTYLDSDNTGGSFSVSRSAKVPFDLPPVITTNLPLSKIVALGTNVTFSLVATGSPPMCYQWYVNGNAIPGATTNTLVVSNNLWTTTGTYYLSASVNNVVGEADSQICAVTVTKSPFAPKVAITSPTPGQLWSNAFFTVTGMASDNAAVSNVLCQINGGAWNSATNISYWTNWAAGVTLAPGTNVVQAYAINTSGNFSPTSSVSLVYVLSAPLTVTTNGLGTLSQNYNNALLQIGKSYSITATAGTGFSFANWTGGTSLPLTILTNGPTVQFLMASNLMLQANLVDTQVPTLTITAPTAGQRWSNAVFNIAGTASDNWQVANVSYLLNTGVWTNASGTTNWSATVNLVPGTNRVWAYATDNTGNRSTTNTASVDFVVTNQLAVTATGLGTLTPNYSNQWLELGRNYSMAATAASGFIFTNWVVSTNWLGGVNTNNASVQFMMASNLTLQVNFLDVTRPTLTITAPTAGQRMTNALATIVGTTADNWKVGAVWYQMTNNLLTTGTWNLIATTNSYTNWSTTVTLAAGTNTVRAYAVDLGGNFSITNNVSFYSSNSFKLQLALPAAQQMAANGLNYALQVSPGINGRVQASTNLINWLTLTNFVGSNATINLYDAAATNFNQRFYRAVTP